MGTNWFPFYYAAKIRHTNAKNIKPSNTNLILITPANVKIAIKSAHLNIQCP